VRVKLYSPVLSHPSQAARLMLEHEGIGPIPAFLPREWLARS
jgi:hypothetical protein